MVSSPKLYEYTQDILNVRAAGGRVLKRDVAFNLYINGDLLVFAILKSAHFSSPT
jgi:hypothetical protein